MPYTSAGKNLMLDALKGTTPTVPITHVGLYDEDAAITAVTGVASTDLFTKAGHGLSNGNLVVIRALTGGTGLFEEHPYYVISVAGDDFQLSRVSGGSAIDFTTNVTTMSVVRLVEVSGGAPAYARKAIAFNTPVDASMDDSTNGAVVDVPAGFTINYVGFFSAVSAGTLLGIDAVTAETFGGQGTYTVTDADLDLRTGGF
jgi:hypothetical protein